MTQISPDFKCTSCGACCSHIDRAIFNSGLAKPYKEMVASFPYKWDKTGKCEMLDKDNKCSVYNNRPLICNLQAQWEKYFYKDMSLAEYYRMQNNACNDLIIDDGLSADLLIPNDQYDEWLK